MPDSSASQAIEQQGIDFVKTNKHLFIDYTFNKISSDEQNNKLAIFMAGTPGSGKTEVTSILQTLRPAQLATIDADQYRGLVPGYNGHNAANYQRAASLAVDQCFTYALHHNYSFILDATFASSRSPQNISRSLRRNYSVLIVFVLQKPQTAWRFTQIRERKGTRYVPLEAFINTYFKSRDNFFTVLDSHLDNEYLAAMLVEKDYNNKIAHIYSKRADIDNLLASAYNSDQLKQELLNGPN